MNPSSFNSSPRRPGAPAPVMLERDTSRLTPRFQQPAYTPEPRDYRSYKGKPRTKAQEPESPALPPPAQISVAGITEGFAPISEQEAKALVIYHALRVFYGRLPFQKEISERMGLVSTQGCKGRLVALAKKGYLIAGERRQGQYGYQPVFPVDATDTHVRENLTKILAKAEQVARGWKDMR